MSPRPRLLPAASLVLALVAACTGATATTSPSQPSATPSAAASASAPASAPASTGASAPSGEAPTTPEAAAALVIAQNQDFLGFNAKDPDLIGQCCWWEVTQSSDGYRVLVHAGWGDCPSGCIENHEWVYNVSPTGEVTLLEESGDDIPAGGIPDGGM
jgi:hypothetical protein